MPDTVDPKIPAQGEAELRQKAAPRAADPDVEISALMLHSAARIFAAVAEKRGEPEILDLIECGFTQQFLERHWTRIAVAGNRIAAERRARQALGGRR